MFPNFVLPLFLALAASTTTLVCASSHDPPHQHRRTLNLTSLATEHDRTNGTHLSRRGFSGRATFFEVGLGACGVYSKDSDYLVALNADQYGDMGAISPWCFQKITISYGGKTAQATVLDACPSCPYGGLDMSPGLFSHFASFDVGVFYMTWSGGSGGGEEEKPTTTEAPKTTTTWFDYASASSASKASADKAWASSSSSKAAADAAWASSSSSKAAADASWASSSSSKAAADASWASSSSSASLAAAQTTTTTEPPTTTTSSSTSTSYSLSPSGLSSSLTPSSTSRSSSSTSSSRSSSSSHSTSSHTTSSRAADPTAQSTISTETVGGNLDGLAQLVLALGNLANAAAAVKS